MNYIWVEAPTLLSGAPHCNSRTCSRAHYRDGEPRRRMTPLVIQPARNYYVSFLYLCEQCKAIRTKRIF